MTLATDTNARRAAPAGPAIRPFDGDADYAAFVAVCNAVAPDYPVSEEEVRHEDATQPGHIKELRLLAELDGAVIGLASYSQNPGMYHPRKFSLNAKVHPAFQGRGVGRALYDAIMEALAPYDPLSVRATTREDRERSVRFLLDRGFVEDVRRWESRLDVAAFDPAPFAGKVERVAVAGFRFVTLAELIASDPDHRRKLYELDLDATRDEPMPEPFTPYSQADFDSWVFDSPNLRPEGFVVAVDGDRYAGLSSLFTTQGDPDTLIVGFTGVARDYRRRGLALALKLLAIDYARRAGVKTLKTWNDSRNAPMLSINRALGFVRQPAWISYLKTIAE